MPCYHPISAWRGKMMPNGKRAIVFKAGDRAVNLVDSALKLPCGQCVGCRLERSRQWAIRCVHEASLYRQNCFLTLTFDKDHYPEDGSLSIRTFQLFMKRLRKAVKPIKIRFFHCGEYGEQFGRPHYHACVFNYDFPDKYLWSVRNGVRLYRSPSLEQIWGMGHATVGDVNFESAAYVARYVLKKVTGRNADEHYVDKATGVLRQPEYVTMSRRPGIGRGWFEKFKSDIFPNDYAVVRGLKVKPPKFYDRLYEVSDPDEFSKVKIARCARGTVFVPAYNNLLDKVQLIDDNGDDRLAVKEEVKLSRLKLLRRTLEEN